MHLDLSLCSTPMFYIKQVMTICMTSKLVRSKMAVVNVKGLIVHNSFLLIGAGPAYVVTGPV